MSSSVGYPSLSVRAISQENILTLRKICDEQKIAYGAFCSIIVGDIIQSEELTQKYIKKTRQFEEDQRPATVAEMKVLREQLRQQEEELQALREFKQTQLSVLNNTH